MVHRHHAEEMVVELGDGLTGPVLVDVTRLEFLEIAAERALVDGHRPRLARRFPRGSCEQPSRDHESLDLVRTLTDDHERRVAVVALDGELRAVSDATVDSQRLGRDL